MRNTLTNIHHFIFTNRDGFILLIHDAHNNQYKLPFFRSILNQPFNGQVARAIALMTSAYITSIDSSQSVGLNNQAWSYLWVKFRGPLSLKQHEGYWADSAHLIQEEAYSGLEEVIEKWKLKRSPRDKTLRSYQGNKPPAFLRGMQAGFDYRRIFRNPEILSDDKEQYLRGWKTARRKVLV